MPRILTVDDSRPIRNMVMKQVAEMGFEVDEAEDGEQGLARLEEMIYDLVVLDVTMPVLDGPGMLAKMREAGNKTPVLMLTSESKRSIVADVMRLGIEDYILKPFKPEELKAKVQKVLKLGAMPAAVATSPAAAPMAPPPVERVEAPTAARQFVDLLVVDDMENVHKKLRSMLPPHVSLQGCTSAQAAFTQCRDRVFRVILIDSEIPDVNSAALMNQLRTLQSHAAFVALPLRSSSDLHKEFTGQGFDDVLYKPFDRDSVDEFLMRYFDDQELVVAEENLVRVGGFSGKEDRMDKYFGRVSRLLGETVDQLAAACFDEMIIDIVKVPAKADRTPRLLIDLLKEARERGLELRVVASPEHKQLFSTFDETAKLALFPTVDAARAA